jgi:hypothetical protein
VLTSLAGWHCNLHPNTEGNVRSGITNHLTMNSADTLMTSHNTEGDVPSGITVQLP